MAHILRGTGGGPVIDAATVVLLRDTPVGPECLMLRKNSGQSFGGAWVFPGGRVEPGDGDGAEGSRRAAVREAAEETGLVLDPDDLVPLAHWLPPPEAPKRFATWFFASALPHGASDVVVDGNEIGDHVWTTAASALGRHRAGEIELVPPTWVTLHRLAGARGVDEALAEIRAGRVEHFQTHIVDDGGVPVCLWAPDAAYEARDVAAPGARHRLIMDPAGWRYERSG